MNRVAVTRGIAKVLYPHRATNPINAFFQLPSPNCFDIRFIVQVCRFLYGPLGDPESRSLNPQFWHNTATRLSKSFVQPFTTVFVKGKHGHPTIFNINIETLQYELILYVRSIFITIPCCKSSIIK